MSDSDLKTRILEAAKEYFFANGFSKSTMEEFSGSLGMSKKTIYKFFPSKEDLIREITHEKIKGIFNKCQVWRNDTAMDFVERVKNITSFISNEMRTMKPIFLLDVQRTMPDLWKEIDEFRNEKILEDFKEMMLSGVKEGVFRSDINFDVFVLMYATSMQAILNPEKLSTLPLNASQAYDAIVSIIFGGVFTPEAKAKYIHNSNVTTVESEEIHL
jgi:AcrR family transcriptional regulator